MRAPVISFTRNSPVVTCYETVEPLSHANMKGLKDPKYDGSLVVDSALHVYSVRAGDIRSGRGPFGGYNIWFNREVIVDLLVVDENRDVSLDELKEMIRSWLPSDAVDESYDESVDPKEERPFLVRLARATNFKEVCQSLQ